MRSPFYSFGADIDELLNPVLNPYNRGAFRPPGKVLLLDSTLREGEQAPNVNFHKSQKLQIAWMLDRFGVNSIEISPIVTPEHEEVCKLLVKEGLRADIIAHIRALKSDIDVALRCDAKWVALFLSVSDIHLAHKLKIDREAALSRITESIEYAKSHGLKVRFSAEDASRAPPDFLVKVCKCAEEAGADRLSITDTVGIMLPHGMYNLVNIVKNSVKIPIDVHCHNDMGLALANALAGLQAGADQIHTTINGIGERAGIPSLAEATLALIAMGVDLNVRLDMLTELSQLVSSYTGIPIPEFAPVVGRNAFRHKSGTHIAAILHNPATYELLSPRAVGNKRRVVFGGSSGKRAIQYMLEHILGLRVSEEEAQRITRYIKGLRRGDLFEVEVPDSGV